MKKNKIILNGNLKQELKNYMDAFNSGMSYQISKDLTNEAKKAINLFYNDYDPVVYYRDYKNFRTRSFINYYPGTKGWVSKGGVCLENNLLPIYYGYKNGSKVSVDTEYIFDLVYSGHHGFVESLPNYKNGNMINIPPIMNPNPMEIILQKQNDIKENILDYIQFGFSKSAKNKYSNFMIY